MKAKIICAYCGKTIGATETKNGMVSPGICVLCLMVHFHLTPSDLHKSGHPPNQNGKPSRFHWPKS